MVGHMSVPFKNVGQSVATADPLLLPTRMSVSACLLPGRLASVVAGILGIDTCMCSAEHQPYMPQHNPPQQQLTRLGDSSACLCPYIYFRCPL